MVKPSHNRPSNLMSLPKDKAWFPAKRYGYGWGVPRRWQGWLVLGLYVIALAAGSIFGRKHPGYFTTYTVGLSTLLLLICVWKGEPARWRWGGD